jgi:hypothetical protein
MGYNATNLYINSKHSRKGVIGYHMLKFCKIFDANTPQQTRTNRIDFPHVKLIRKWVQVSCVPYSQDTVSVLHKTNNLKIQNTNYITEGFSVTFFRILAFLFYFVVTWHSLFHSEASWPPLFRFVQALPAVSYS